MTHTSASLPWFHCASRVCVCVCVKVCECVLWLSVCVCVCVCVFVSMFICLHVAAHKEAVPDFEDSAWVCLMLDLRSHAWRRGFLTCTRHLFSVSRRRPCSQTQQPSLRTSPQARAGMRIPPTRHRQTWPKIRRAHRVRVCVCVCVCQCVYVYIYTYI